MPEFIAHFKSVQPDLGGSLPGNLIFSIPGKDGGYYLVAAEQTDANTIRFTFTPSQKEMPAVDPVDITLPNATGAGLTTAQINALDGLFKIAAYTKDARAEYAAFQSAFGLSGGEEPDEPDVPVIPDEPEKALTSISAVYSGGSVTAGTAVSALTGIVVTAHYSDGTSEVVTGYALSGTIAEGSNTITVSYGGKATTFTVTGVAESGGETTENPFDSVTWTDGKYIISSGGNTGNISDNANYTISSAVDVSGYASVIVEETGGSSLRQYGMGFYNSGETLNKTTFVSYASGYIRKDNDTYPSPVTVAIPEGATHCVLCLKGKDETANVLEFSVA